MIASRPLSPENSVPADAGDSSAVAQKADKHLITLRLIFKLHNVAEWAAELGQLSDTAKDEKRGADGGTDRVDS